MRFECRDFDFLSSGRTKAERLTRAMAEEEARKILVEGKLPSFLDSVCSGGNFFEEKRFLEDYRGNRASAFVLALLIFIANDEEGMPSKIYASSLANRMFVAENVVMTKRLLDEAFKCFLVAGFYPFINLPSEISF